MTMFSNEYIQKEYTKFIGKGKHNMISVIRNGSGIRPEVEAVLEGYRIYLANGRKGNTRQSYVFNEMVKATFVEPTEDMADSIERLI